MGNFFYSVVCMLPFTIPHVYLPFVCVCDIYAHGFNGMRYVLKWDFDNMCVK